MKSFIPHFAAMWIRVFLMVDGVSEVPNMGNCTLEQLTGFAIRRAFDGQAGVIFCFNPGVEV